MSGSGASSIGSEFINDQIPIHQREVQFFEVGRGWWHLKLSNPIEDIGLVHKKAEILLNMLRLDGIFLGAKSKSLICFSMRVGRLGCCIDDYGKWFQSGFFKLPRGFRNDPI